MLRKGKRFIGLGLCAVLILSLFNISFVQAKGKPPTVEVTLERTFIPNVEALEQGQELEVKYTITPQSIKRTYIPRDKEVVVIIDTSGSMKERIGGYYSQSKMAVVKQAAKQFFQKLSQADNVKAQIIDYNNEANGVVNGQFISTKQEQYFSSKIDSLYANGGTNIGDAIRKAYYNLTHHDSSPNADKYMVLLTDGEPTFYSFEWRRQYDYWTGYYKWVKAFVEDGRTEGYYTNLANDYNRGYRYAVDMARMINSNNRIQSYYIGFTSQANRLEDISKQGSQATSTYYQALTADDIEQVYSDLADQILSEFSVNDVYAKLAIPQGFTVIGKPDGFSYHDSQKLLTGRLLNFNYKLNSAKTYYEADPIEFRIKLRLDKMGNYIFGANNSSFITYSDKKLTGAAVEVGDPVVKYFEQKDFRIKGANSKEDYIDKVVIVPAKTQVGEQEKLAIDFQIKGKLVDLYKIPSSYSLTPEGDFAIGPFAVQIQMPEVGLEPIDLPAGFSYDAANHILKGKLATGTMIKKGANQYQLQDFSLKTKIKFKNSKDVMFAEQAVNIKYADVDGKAVEGNHGQQQKIIVTPAAPTIDDITGDNIVTMDEAGKLDISGKTKNPHTAVYIQITDSTTLESTKMVRLMSNEKGVFNGGGFDVSEFSGENIVAKAVVMDDEGQSATGTKQAELALNTSLLNQVLVSTDANQKMVGDALTVTYQIAGSAVNLPPAMTNNQYAIKDVVIRFNVPEATTPSKLPSGFKYDAKTGTVTGKIKNLSLNKNSDGTYSVPPTTITMDFVVTQSDDIRITKQDIQLTYVSPITNRPNTDSGSNQVAVKVKPYLALDKISGDDIVIASELNQVVVSGTVKPANSTVFDKNSLIDITIKDGDGKVIKVVTGLSVDSKGNFKSPALNLVGLVQLGRFTVEATIIDQDGDSSQVTRTPQYINLIDIT